MELNNIIRNLKKVSLNTLFFRKAAIPGKGLQTRALDSHFFRNKKVAIMGEFFPMNKFTLEENLQKTGAILHSKITSDTEILICGKFPDWMLVRQAKINGIQLIFVDKAGELFTVLLSGMNEGRSFLNYEEPLGV